MRFDFCRDRGFIRTIFAVPAVVLLLAASVPAQSTQEDKPEAEGPPQGPPPALVRFGLVDSQVLRARWEAVGRLREIKRAVVAAEQEGRITEINVDEGDRVVGGKTVLARTDDAFVKLDIENAKAQVQRALAGIEEAKAQLDRAARDREYMQELDREGVAKPKELKDAINTEQVANAVLLRAKAEYQASETQLALLEEQLDRHVVVAPFDGVIVAKLTELGQWAKPGDPLVELISSGPIDALVNVPERLINHVKVGDSIELDIEALGTSVDGKVFSVNPSGMNAARTFPVKIRFDDQQGRFKAGMTVIAHIPTTQEQQLLTVPRDAVRRTDTGALVWVNADGKALPSGVKVLFGVGERFAVSPIDGSGPPLHVGMQVVIEGAERLFPTQPLMDADAKPAGPEPKAGDTALTGDSSTTQAKM